jgi:assimilatory nitrate reductase catalytic subunit
MSLSVLRSRLDYVWQARENGAKVIVVDPRITPIGRTCDLLLPIKPGRDIALFNGILHLMIKNDWIDRTFVQNHTVGFDEVATAVEEWTPTRTAEITGIAAKGILQAGGGEPRPVFSCTHEVSNTAAMAFRMFLERSI